MPVAQKATKAFLDLLKNAEANAEEQHLTKVNLTVNESCVVSAHTWPKMRRRINRAHDRINDMCRGGGGWVAEKERQARVTVQ